LELRRLSVKITSMLFAIFFFLLGLVVGSFLNVVIYRIPKGLSIVYPPSHCPVCKKPIKFYDNIPILSYLLLKGRCRHCKSKISPIYPIVEGLTGILFLSIYLKFRPHLLITLKYLIVTSLLIPISFIDFKEKIIPDSLTIPWIGIGWLFNIITKDLNFMQVFLTTLISGFIFGLLRLIFSKALRREALGEGDITLIMLISSFTGFWGAYLSMLIGSVTAILAHLVFPEKLKDEIPFGPFLSIGALVRILTI